MEKTIELLREFQKRDRVSEIIEKEIEKNGKGYSRFNR